MIDTASAAPSDAELFPLIEKHFGMVPRRDDTVIDRRTGRFHDAQRYRDFAADLLSARAQPTPPADSVLEDAERYRFLAEHCRSTSEHWGGRWSIIVDGPAPKSHDSEDDFDKAVDAARKQGANHD